MCLLRVECLWSLVSGSSFQIVSVKEFVCGVCVKELRTIIPPSRVNAMAEQFSSI